MQYKELISQWRLAVLNLTIPFVVVLCGALLLTLASMAPSEPARQQFITGVLKEGLAASDYPEVKYRWFNFSTVDSFSECVAFAVALSNSPLAFASEPHSANLQEEGCAAFRSAVEMPSGYGTYSRFYHGASAVIRVALTSMSLRMLRLTTTVFLIVVSAAIVMYAATQSRLLAIGIFSYLFLLSDTLFEGLSLPFGLSGLAGLAGALAAAVLSRKHLKFTIAASASAGSCYAIMAQLLVPMEFAILTAILVMSPALRKTRGQRTELLRYGVLAATGWVGGYASAMVIRMLWAAWILGVDVVLAEASNAAAGRITTSIRQPVIAVLGLLKFEIFDFMIRGVGLLCIVALAAWAIGAGRHWSLRPYRLLQASTPAFFGIAWLALMGGHDGHGWVIHVVDAILLNALFVVLLNLRLAQDSDPAGDSRAVLLR